MNISFLWGKWIILYSSRHNDLKQLLKWNRTGQTENVSQKDCPTKYTVHPNILFKVKQFKHKGVPSKNVNLFLHDT